MTFKEELLHFLTLQIMLDLLTLATWVGVRYERQAASCRVPHRADIRAALAPLPSGTKGAAGCRSSAPTRAE